MGKQYNDKENMIMMKMSAKDGYVAERYIDHSVPYIRVKYKNKHRTEVIMQESVFERVYGSLIEDRTKFQYNDCSLISNKKGGFYEYHKRIREQRN